jgi:hypothetical protein
LEAVTIQVAAIADKGWDNCNNYCQLHGARKARFWRLTADKKGYRKPVIKRETSIHGIGCYTPTAVLHRIKFQGSRNPRKATSRVPFFLKKKMGVWKLFLFK